MTWSYCAKLVKDLDPDRFLLTLHQPKAKHEDLFALLAFNAEVAKTATVVTQEMLGHIRLQWWREAVEELYTADGDASAVRQHEVLQSMLGLTACVPKHLLLTIIDAHTADLDAAALSDIDKLEAYCANTTGALMRCQGLILNSSLSLQLEQSLNHLGTAWCLSQLATGRYAHGHLIPAEMSIGELAQLTLSHLERTMHNAPTPVAKLALYVKHIEHRVSYLEKAKFDPASPINQKADGLLAAKIWWASIRA